MEGWICLHRKLLNWQWYQDTNVKVLFIHLLLKANYEDKVWKNIVIKRGQLVTSISKLAEETRQTIRQTRVALDKLKMTNEITIKTTNKYTLITIEKYDNFQNIENINDKQNDKEDDKQMTNKCQATWQTKGQQHNNINNKQYNNILSNNNYLYNTREEIFLKALRGEKNDS